MDYEPLAIMGMAISIGIGHYSLFYLYMEKSFVRRYKAFKDAFNRWMEDEVTKFYDNLTSMVEKKADPEELLNFVNEWGTRTANLLDIFQTYKSISKNVRLIWLGLVGSIVASGLHIENPSVVLNPGAPRPLYWISIAITLLFFSVLGIFWYMYSFHKVSSKVTQFELGESLENILLQKKDT